MPDAKRVNAEKKPEKSFNLWENSKMGFGDFVDIINPLQHIPIIATIIVTGRGDTLGFGLARHRWCVVGPNWRLRHGCC